MSNFPHNEVGKLGFYGMMVGGPEDGMFFAAPYDRHRVAELPFDESAPGWSQATIDETRPKITTFKWVEGLAGPNACDFWVPEDKDREWAIHKILGAYADRGRK